MLSVCPRKDSQWRPSYYDLVGFNSEHLKVWFVSMNGVRDKLMRDDLLCEKGPFFGGGVGVGGGMCITSFHT